MTRRRSALCCAMLLLPWMAHARELRVCADPNNLPFSNAAGEGFENRIIALLAKDLGAHVDYTWWAQRRGAIRNTLDAGHCDVIPGMASSGGMTGTTDPYYRSTYVFVTRAGRGLDDLASLDDPQSYSPQVAIWTEDRLPWVQLSPERKTFQQGREQPPV